MIPGRSYKEIELAYMAGIIDGEGSIYIGNFSCNPKTGTPYYQTNIEITNTDIGLIDWISEVFGGRRTLYTAKQTPKNSRRAVHRWIISGEQMTQLCHALLPYLIIKKPQALIMIKMRETFERPTAEIGHQGALSLEQNVLDLRKKYFDEMRALHCRNYTNK